MSGPVIDYDQPTFNCIPEPDNQYRLPLSLPDKPPEEWAFPAYIEAELAKRVNGPTRESSR